MQSTTLLEK